MQYLPVNAKSWSSHRRELRLNLGRPRGGARPTLTTRKICLAHTTAVPTHTTFPQNSTKKTNTKVKKDSVSIRKTRCFGFPDTGKKQHQTGSNECQLTHSRHQSTLCKKTDSGRERSTFLRTRTERHKVGVYNLLLCQKRSKQSRHPPETKALTYSAGRAGHKHTQRHRHRHRQTHTKKNNTAQCRHGCASKRDPA